MTRDEIRGQFKRRIVAVDVPGWDRQAHVREWEGTRLGLFDELMQADKSTRTVWLRSVGVMLSLCDESGTYTFDGTKEDAEFIRDSLSALALSNLYDAANELNGMTGRKQVEDAEKN